MADISLLDRQIDISIRLANSLAQVGAPLLASYWELREDRDRWVLLLVPRTFDDQRKLLDQTFDLLREPPYRDAFSVSDVVVDSRQIERARVIGAYIRRPSAIGWPINPLFTGGHYFEGLVPVYFASELMPQPA